MMKYAEANKFYGQVGRQVGDRLMYITSDGISERIHGYKIISFDGLEPLGIEYVNTVQPTKDIDTWNKTYDALFGAPVGKPDFIGVIN